MTPFVDFKGLNKTGLKLLHNTLASIPHYSNQPNVKPIVEEFMEFVLTTLRTIQERLKAAGYTGEIGELKLDYNPQDEPERFLKEIWNNQAELWALIETMQTYYLTMQTILEKLEIPPSKHLRLVSLGSGPGLYESFLATFFGSNGIGGTVTCVDFAEEMTAMHRFVLSQIQPRICNIELVTSDMSHLPIPDRSVDAVLCNNSLQWCTNWKKAIAEMARILDPAGMPRAYFVVHLHKQPMCVLTNTGKRPIRLPRILTEEIMDELEINMFTIVSTRQMCSKTGGGQAGGTLDRVFLKTEFTPEGLKHAWRDAKKTLTGGKLMNFKKQ